MFFGRDREAAYDLMISSNDSSSLICFPVGRAACEKYLFSEKGIGGFDSRRSKVKACVASGSDLNEMEKTCCWPDCPAG